MRRWSWHLCGEHLGVVRERRRAGTEWNSCAGVSGEEETVMSKKPGEVERRVTMAVVVSSVWKAMVRS